MNNVRVLSYIIGSCEPAIALTLRSFPSAAAVWTHLKTTYSHVNTSCFFDLEYALANLTQGESSINEYYLAATQLWTEIDLISTVLVTGAANSNILKERNRSRCLQFLMRLRPEYEQVRSRLISDANMDINTILGELIRAETQFQTQAQLDGQTISNSAFAAGVAAQFSSKGSFNLTSPSATTQANNSGNTSGSIKCHFFQELGHPQSLCRKRNICSYCKRSGHIIVDCRAPGRKNFGTSRGNTSFTAQSVSPASMVSSGLASTNEHSTVVSASSVASVNGSLNIGKLVQLELARALPQALHSAFASFGLSGKPSSRPWYIDSAAFNHMSGDARLLCSYNPVRDQSVEVANGQSLPVAGIGTIQTNNITLPSSLYVPALVPNLVSI
ncbi:hypothetical protein LINGRAHAP2_LOCUS2010 [Linum grandiflorum]